MFVDNPEFQAPEVKARRPERARAGFFEGIGAAFLAEQLETDAWGQRSRVTDNVFTELETTLRSKVGDDVVDKAMADPRRREQPGARKVRRQNALLDLAGTVGDPDLPATRDAAMEKARERYQEEYQDAVETLNYMRAGRIAGEFMGRGAAAVTDPTSLMLMVAGGGTGSIARVVLRESLLGALGEAMVLPRQYSMAEYLDIEDPNPVAQVTMGALFAGGLAGSGAAATRAGRSAISDELARALAYASARTRRSTVADTAAVNAAEDAISNDVAQTVAPRVLTPEERIFTEESPRPWEQPGDPGAQVEAEQADDVEIELRAEIDRLRGEVGTRTRPIASWLRNDTVEQRAGGGVSTNQVHPEGRAAAELRARGITPRSMPGLFSRNGRQSFNNLPAEELEEMFPGITEEAGVSDDGLYLNEDGLLDMLADEINGNPRLRNNVDLAAAEADLDAYLRMRDVEQERFDPLPDTDDVAALKDQMDTLARAVDDYDQTFGLGLSDRERADVTQALAENGGRIGDAIDAMDAADLEFARTPDDGPLSAERSAPLDDADYAAQSGRGEPPVGQPGDSGRTAQGRAAGEGTDRGARTERTEAGDQFVAPGVDPITQRERLEAQQASAMSGGDAAADFGLFDTNARDQVDMFADGGLNDDIDEFGRAAQDDMRAELEDSDLDFEMGIDVDTGQVQRKAASAWLDELDADQDFVEIAELCKSGGAT